jgi:uncharacterized membrane protein
METADNVKSVVSRIKWRSVVALILFVAVLVLLWQSMPGSFAVGSGVGIRVSPNPATIVPGGSTSLDVELKNVKDKGDVSVVVKAQAYDKNLAFDDSGTQNYGSASITLGPQETRKVKLKVKSQPGILEGKYTFDFIAVPSGEDIGAETRVSLTVEKSA